jgi:hypothetical protein
MSAETSAEPRFAFRKNWLRFPFDYAANGEVVGLNGGRYARR